LYLINYFDRISVLTFLPYIQKDLSLSPIQVGWLASIFFFGYAIAQFSAGYLADRIGPKRTMTIAIWCFTVVTFLTGLVQSFTQFMILRVGLALGEGHHFAPAVRIIANWVPREEKGRANAILATTYALGPAIVPIVVTQIAAAFFGGAWRPVFFVLVLPGLVGVFLLWKYADDSPKAMLQKGKSSQEEYDLITSSINVEASEHGKTYSTKMFMTDIHFYVFVVGFTCLLMIFWGFSSWISTFLVRQHGMNLRAMGVFASLPFIIGFLATYLGGWLADKVFRGKPKIVNVLSFLGCIPVLYLFPHVAKGDTGMLLLCLFVGGFFINLQWAITTSFASWRYPKELVGRVVGVSHGIGQFGSFLSPLAAGYLVIENPDMSFYFGNVFLFWSVLAVVGALAFAFLNTTPIENISRFEVDTPEPAITPGVRHA
jgi:sugar phosphate permease